MNRVAAKQLAQKGVTVAALRETIKQRRRLGAGQISRINAAMTVEQACQIFEDALEGRADDYVMAAGHHSDLLMATNILQECS